MEVAVGVDRGKLLGEHGKHSTRRNVETTIAKERKSSLPLDSQRQSLPITRSNHIHGMRAPISQPFGGGESKQLDLDLLEDFQSWRVDIQLKPCLSKAFIVW